MSLATDMPTCECACQVCKAACERRPGWPLPAEAEALIDAGFANRLMLDYWSAGDGTKRDVMILCPAVIGREGRSAAWMPTGRCSFLTDEGLCEVHAIKPRECAFAACASRVSDARYKAARFSIVRAWNTPRGRALVERWRAIVECDATQPGEDDDEGTDFWGDFLSSIFRTGNAVAANLE